MTDEQIMKKYKILKKRFISEYGKELAKEYKYIKGTGVCEKCDDCHYQSSNDKICNYMIAMGKRRPCPPWDCTVYKKGVPYNERKPGQTIREHYQREF